MAPPPFKKPKYRLSDEHKNKIRLSMIRNGHRPPPAKRGSENSRWNGGRKVLKGGYIGVYNQITKTYTPEHRLVMEKFLGRVLKQTEVVHHINEVRTDNRLENLKLYKKMGEHIRDNHTHKDRYGRFHKLGGVIPGLRGVYRSCWSCGKTKYFYPFQANAKYCDRKCMFSYYKGKTWKQRKIFVFNQGALHNLK